MEPFGRTPIAMRAGSAFRVAVTKYQPGTVLQQHYHENASLSLILDGSYEERIGTKSFPCNPFTAVYKAPALSHANYFGSAEVNAIFIEADLPGIRQIPDVVPLRSVRTEALIRRMAGEIRQRVPGYEIIVESCALELWATIARSSVTRMRSVPPWLRRAHEYVEAHYTTSFGLSQVASVAGVHPVYLAQAFRRFFGRSIGEHVREQRLDHACRLLCTTSRPVGEIAFECGFADHSHLTRAFRMHRGLTPTEYRRLHGSAAAIDLSPTQAAFPPL